MSTILKLGKDREDPISEVMKFGGEGIKKCIQCGACMSVCPVALAGFNYPNKKLFKLIMLGIRKEILHDPSPWACVGCGRCIEICTRDVNPFFVYFAFRRIQAREYSIPSASEEALHLLYETGHAIPFAGVEKLREELNLPRIPPSTLSNPKALQEIRKILANTEIAELGILPLE